MEFIPTVFYQIICDVIRAMPIQTDKAGNTLTGERINTFVVTNERDYYNLPESKNLRRSRRYLKSGVFYSRINENNNQQSPNLIAYQHPLAVLVPLNERGQTNRRTISYILNIMDTTPNRDIDVNAAPKGDFVLSEIGLEKLAHLYQVLAASINDFVFANATLAGNPIFSKWIAKTELERLKTLGQIDKWEVLNHVQTYASSLLDAYTAQQSEGETSLKLIAYAVNFEIKFQTPCAQPIESYGTQTVAISQKECC